MPINEKILKTLREGGFDPRPSQSPAGIIAQPFKEAGSLLSGALRNRLQQSGFLKKADIGFSKIAPAAEKIQEIIGEGAKKAGQAIGSFAREIPGAFGDIKEKLEVPLEDIQQKGQEKIEELAPEVPILSPSAPARALEGKISAERQAGGLIPLLVKQANAGFLDISSHVDRELFARLRERGLFPRQVGIERPKKGSFIKEFDNLIKSFFTVDSAEAKMPFFHKRSLPKEQLKKFEDRYDAFPPKIRESGDPVKPPQMSDFAPTNRARPIMRNYDTSKNLIRFDKTEKETKHNIDFDIPRNGMYDVWISVQYSGKEQPGENYKLQINDGRVSPIIKDNDKKGNQWVWHKAYDLKKGNNKFTFFNDENQIEKGNSRSIRIAGITARPIIDPDDMLLPFGYPEDVLREGGWPDFDKMTKWSAWGGDKQSSPPGTKIPPLKKIKDRPTTLRELDQQIRIIQQQEQPELEVMQTPTQPKLKVIS